MFGIALTRFPIAVDKLHFFIDALKCQWNAEILTTFRVCQGMEFFGNKSGVSFIAIKPVLLRFTKLAVPGANPDSIIHERSGSCKVSCVAYIGVEVDASTGEANIKS